MTGNARGIVEIAVVAPRTVFVSLSNGNFLVPDCSPLGVGSPWLTTMAPNPSISSTRALLAAAFYAALKEQQEAGGGCDSELTLPGVILNLIGSYHTTHATARLLPVAADRFRALGRLSLVDFLEKKIREESGHHRLALMDLRALGLPAERLVAAIKPSMIVNLLNYFEAVAYAADPMGAVGYSYALERNALFSARNISKRCRRCVHRAWMPPAACAFTAGQAPTPHTLRRWRSSLRRCRADDGLAVLRSVYETMKIIAAPSRRGLHDRRRGREHPGRGYLLSDAVAPFLSTRV